jgi:hypothetical protein
MVQWREKSMTGKSQNRACPVSKIHVPIHVPVRVHVHVSVHVHVHYSLFYYNMIRILIS